VETVWEQGQSMISFQRLLLVKWNGMSLPSNGLRQLCQVV